MPREKIKMKSSASDYVYMTKKNKKTSTGRLKRKKYDPNVRQHVEFTEAK